MLQWLVHPWLCLLFVVYTNTFLVFESASGVVLSTPVCGHTSFVCDNRSGVHSGVSHLNFIGFGMSLAGRVRMSN